MDNIREDFRPLIEEIAEIEECEPSEVTIDRLPFLAERCGAMAYVKGGDYPHLREFLRQVYIEGVSPFEKYLNEALETLGVPDAAEWRRKGFTVIE